MIPLLLRPGRWIIMQKDTTLTLQAASPDYSRAVTARNS
jgi:hypothetical protein